MSRLKNHKKQNGLKPIAICAQKKEINSILSRCKNTSHEKPYKSRRRKDRASLRANPDWSFSYLKDQSSFYCFSFY